MGRNHRFPCYSSEGLREGEWGSSSHGVPAPSSPRSSGKLNQLPSRRGLPCPPGKGRWVRVERGRGCQLGRPLAGRAITLLLLNFTTWAVVLTMRLVFGCPINLPLEAFRDGAVDLIVGLWKEEECATCSGREQQP